MLVYVLSRDRAQLPSQLTNYATSLEKFVMLSQVDRLNSHPNCMVTSLLVGTFK